MLNVEVKETDQCLEIYGLKRGSFEQHIYNHLLYFATIFFRQYESMVYLFVLIQDVVPRLDFTGISLLQMV